MPNKLTFPPRSSLPPSARSAAILEQQETLRTLIIDSSHQTAMLAGEHRETILLDPTTGSRCFTATNTILRTTDGRLIRDIQTDSVFACTVCRNQPLSEAAVCFCASCRRIICRDCAKQFKNEPSFYCRPCFRKQQRKRFFTWLLLIDP